MLDIFSTENNDISVLELIFMKQLTNKLQDSPGLVLFMEMDIFSFFSGAGFLDLGFEEEGFNIVFVNEYNESFLTVYKFARKNMNLKSPQYGYFCGDINDLFRGDLKQTLTKNVRQSKEEALVGFIGGPPCPDFSIAGKNEGISGKNGMLTNSFKRIILSQEPDFFCVRKCEGIMVDKKAQSGV